MSTQRLVRIANEVARLEKQAAGPSYKTYVKKKKERGEKPLSKKQWEVRVKGKGKRTVDTDEHPVALKLEDKLTWKKGKRNRKKLHDGIRDALDKGGLAESDLGVNRAGHLTVKTKEGEALSKKLQKFKDSNPEAYEEFQKDFREWYKGDMVEVVKELPVFFPGVKDNSGWGMGGGTDPVDGVEWDLATIEQVLDHHMKKAS